MLLHGVNPHTHIEPLKTYTTTTHVTTVTVPGITLLNRVEESGVQLGAEGGGGKGTRESCPVATYTARSTRKCIHWMSTCLAPHQ